MKRAVIIYNSKTGTTQKYAEEIGDYLKQKEIEVSLSSIQEYRDDILANADYLLLGCWTSGLLIFNQKPEEVWVDFAKQLPSVEKAQTAFFTTYKVRTGSMFKNMHKHLNNRFRYPSVELKSRKGKLTENDKLSLDKLVN